MDRVPRPDSGQVVHKVEASLPGWEPEALLTALRGWGLDDLVFIVGNGDEVVAVRPFPMGEEWGGSVVAFKGAFYTYSYQLSTEPETPHGDRRSAVEVRGWCAVEPGSAVAPTAPGTTPGYGSLVAGPNELMMTVKEDGGTSLWTSTDGSYWLQAAIDAQQGDDLILWDPLPTEFGWTVAGTSGGWVSEDGLDWERIDLPPAGGDFPTVDYLGVYFRGPWEESGDHVIWVGSTSLDTVSGDVDRQERARERPRTDRRPSACLRRRRRCRREHGPTPM